MYDRLIHLSCDKDTVETTNGGHGLKQQGDKLSNVIINAQKDMSELSNDADLSVIDGKPSFRSVRIQSIYICIPGKRKFGNGSVILSHTL